jgi:hypothetical protein
MEKQISPGLKTLFLVHAIVGIIFGLAYLLMPDAWGSLTGVPMEDPGWYRAIGAAILGFAASSWLAYREAAWDKVKIVVQMEVVWSILGTLVALWGLLFAGFPTADWLNALVLGGFAAAFSYFYFRG